MLDQSLGLNLSTGNQRASLMAGKTISSRRKWSKPEYGPRLVRFYLPGGLDPIHVRHNQIHQNDFGEIYRPASPPQTVPASPTIWISARVPAQLSCLCG